MVNRRSRPQTRDADRQRLTMPGYFGRRRFAVRPPFGGPGCSELPRRSTGTAADASSFPRDRSRDGTGGERCPTTSPCWSDERRRKPRSWRGCCADAGETLPQPEHDAAFGAFFDRFGDARVVLLGEATHGTSEFYRARAAITKRLITSHGFNIVAVEADWPDAARIDRYVRHLAPAKSARQAFERFPTWMWRNEEVLSFLDWLRHAQREPAGRAADVIPRSRRVQPRRVDRGGARLSRQGRSERRFRRAPALRLPDAVAGRAGRLRPRGALRAEGFVRGGGDRAAQRTACASARLHAAGRRGVFRRGAERAHRARRRALLPDHVSRRQRIVESARPPYVRHAADVAARRRGAGRRPSSGRTTRISATPPRPRWAGTASSISANCAAPLTATRRC